MFVQALLGALAMPGGIAFLAVLGLLLVAWALRLLAAAPHVAHAPLGAGVEAVLVRLRRPNSPGRTRSRAPTGTPAPR
uniref:hypothetical protein n=1 Tax=Herbidospora sakaeratensis TaxID=564415 RepID=UPI000780B800|nr:hypothetical protein [Herbidospora sakaeratensis]